MTTETTNTSPRDSMRFPPGLPRIVLASASPRRRDLLRQAGIPFAVDAAAVDETELPDESPEAHVRRLAGDKVGVVARRHPEDCIVLGADTVVVLDGRIFGKPVDLIQAHDMLAELSSHWHEVLTGVAILRRRPHWECRWVSRTRVHFRVLSPDDIAAYCQRVHPLDKAGAYGIQEHGGLLADELDGPISTVIGLPLERVVEVLRTVPDAETAPPPG